MTCTIPAAGCTHEFAFLLHSIDNEAQKARKRLSSSSSREKPGVTCRSHSLTSVKGPRERAVWPAEVHRGRAAGYTDPQWVGGDEVATEALKEETGS